MRKICNFDKLLNQEAEVPKSPELESLEIELKKIEDAIQRLSNQDDDAQQKKIWHLIKQQKQLNKKVINKNN